MKTCFLFGLMDLAILLFMAIFLAVIGYVLLLGLTPESWHSWVGRVYGWGLLGALGWFYVRWELRRIRRYINGYDEDYD